MRNIDAWLRSSWVRKARALVALTLVATAATVTAVPQPAAAAGWVDRSCPDGRACVFDNSVGAWYWVADGCGLHNMGDQWFQDRAIGYQTHGNAILLGNYKGSGDPYVFGNFDWSDYKTAWTREFLPPGERNIYDAMFVYCF